MLEPFIFSSFRRLCRQPFLCLSCTWLPSRLFLVLESINEPPFEIPPTFVLFSAAFLPCFSRDQRAAASEPRLVVVKTAADVRISCSGSASVVEFNTGSDRACTSESMSGSAAAALSSYPYRFQPPRSNPQQRRVRWANEPVGKCSGSSPSDGCARMKSGCHYSPSKDKHSCHNPCVRLAYIICLFSLCI